MKQLLAIVLLFASAAAAAEIYRYVDDDGSVHYTDEPPAEYKDAAEAVELEPVPTIELDAPTQIDVSRTQRSAKTADRGGSQSYAQVAIAQPQNEQTIRDATHTLTVVVQSEPALRTKLGHGVRFFLDGDAVNSEPLNSNTLVMREVYRGAHTVSAEIVNAQGNVVGTAEAVTVFMKPPRAR
ncbi:DUF4124 domain-containing protein [bacterium]|nr:DUF4124 domain-containing protein [bacterium]